MKNIDYGIIVHIKNCLKSVSEGYVVNAMIAHIAILICCIGLTITLIYWIFIKNYQRKITEQITIGEEKELLYQAALKVLIAEYTAAYICDLKMDTVNLLKRSRKYHDGEAEYVFNFNSYTSFMKGCFDKFIVGEASKSYESKFRAEELMKIMQKQDTYAVRMEMRPDQQGNRYYEIRAVKLFVNDKQFKVIMGYRPIDALLKEEQERNQQLQDKNELLKKQHLEIKKANAAKSNFLRRMSHDIRTPINAIVGAIQVASQEPGNLQLQNETRAKVITASKYLLRLISDILDMSKLESGVIKIEHKPFDLQKLLDDSSEIIRMKSDARNLTYHIDTTGLIHKNVIGSPKHFQQVFMNITSNAVKYNRDGGMIDVVCKEIYQGGKTAEIEISCTDTGCGISEEFQKHIFEPFAQEKDKDARTKYEGTGLGMSIAKQLIELQHGYIALESHLGFGTKFVIHVPFELGDEAVEKQQAEQEVSLKDLNILLVEDNELNMDIAEFLLKSKGAKVTKAWNGLEALKTFEQSPKGAFDVILTDIMMPVMNGLEAARKIRLSAHVDSQAIPIIAMSANAFQDDVERSLQAGMNAHLAKPLNLNNVLHTISKFTKNACSA